MLQGFCTAENTATNYVDVFNPLESVHISVPLYNTSKNLGLGILGSSFGVKWSTQLQMNKIMIGESHHISLQ